MFLNFSIPNSMSYPLFVFSSTKMTIYHVGTVQIHLPGLRCGSILSIVKFGKQSLFAITHIAILTHKIHLLV